MAYALLTHETAHWYWMHTSRPVHEYVYHYLNVPRQNAAELEEAVRGTMFEGMRLHVLSSYQGKHSTQKITYHLSSEVFLHASFVQVAPMINVVRPELSFLQAACFLSFPQLLAYGFALCGTFCLDETSETGLSSREPITSCEKLRAYALENPHMRGAKTALRALRYIVPGSASPRETATYLLLCLPYVHGGKGLAPASLNREVPIPDAMIWPNERRSFRCDLFWEEANVSLEYDSDLHATARGIADDAVKRNTLVALGHRPFSMTRLQLNDPQKTSQTAQALRRALGLKPRPLPKDYAAKEAFLRAELGFGAK